MRAKRKRARERAIIYFDQFTVLSTKIAFFVLVRLRYD